MKEERKVKFSIIIPCLNEEKYLPLLLKDLSKQTFKDFEVIVVDAKSEDNTVKFAFKLKSKFKRFEVLESKIRNVSHQRNLGAKKAKSDWLIFMDADNRLPKKYLQKLKLPMKKTNINILATWFNTDSSNISDKITAYISNLFMDIQKKTKHPWVQDSLLCIQKNSFNKLGGFNEDLHWGEGSVLVEKAIGKGMKYTLIKEPSYTFSFRRIKKHGLIKMFFNITKLELVRSLGSNISIENKKKLYPMDGGKSYD